jgi:AraC-like DNA-binding protein
MKLTIEKVNNSPDSSFNIEHNVLPYFISTWHFHPEIEIVLIERGTGTLFAGDYNKSFGPGALALIGTSLPHVWLNDKKYYEPKSTLIAESIVLKFNDDFIGENFLNLPETAKLKTLIKNASRGMLFLGKTQETLAIKIRTIIKQRGFDKIMNLLSMLDLMSNTSEFEFLASKGFSATSMNESDSSRIDKVYKYVMNNFSQDIPLEKIAETANMSPTSFCRYFKAHTRKTFSQFVNEVRISHACKLLIEKKHTISEISYQSGFNYLSNFFKQFKLIMKSTPQEYQKKYWS